VRLAAALGADADTHDLGGIESAVRTYKDILGTHIRTYKDILGTHRLPLVLTPTPMTLAALRALCMCMYVCMYVCMYDERGVVV